MFFCKNNKVKAKLDNYALTVHVQSKDEPKVAYIDLSEFPSAEFLIKEKEGKFALVVKSLELNESREICTFEKRKEAVKAVKAVATAMLSSGSGFSSGLKRLLGWTVKLVIVAGVITLAFDYIATPSMPALPEQAKAKTEQGAAPQAQPQGALQQEKLPEGKPVPLESIVK